MLATLVPALAAFIVRPPMHMRACSYTAMAAAPAMVPTILTTARIGAPVKCEAVAEERSVAEIHADADMVFAVIDVDGDGTVTLDEITEHLIKSGYKPEAISKIFEKLDTDQSGSISQEELRAGFVNYSPLRKAPGFGNYNDQFKEKIHVDADALFSAVDANNDGEITDAELRVHLRQFSSFSDPAISNLFTMLDIDENGGIDKEELRKAFVRFSALRLAIGTGPNYV